MSPILFYGVPEGCSFGSIVALEWLGVPYRLCRIEMPAVVSSAAFRRINPVAETPALMTEDGTVLSESLAILNHLGAQAMDSGLAFRQGTTGFDRLNSVLAFLNTTFFNAFSPLWYALESGAAGAEKAALTAYGRALAEKAHADLEAAIGEGEWLLGPRTLADAYFAGIVRWADFHGVVERQAYPRLARLRSRLEAEPAVRFAQAVEHGEPAASGGGFEGHVGLQDALGLLRTAA